MPIAFQRIWLFFKRFFALGHKRPPHSERAWAGHPGWRLDRSSGTWVWDDDPWPPRRPIWSGGCDEIGRAAGHGVLEWRGQRTRDRYEGMLCAGKYDGVGLLLTRDGHRLEGEFKDGLLHGRGAVHYSSGTLYQGELREGQFHGPGKLTSSQGVVVEGTWHHNKVRGKGTIRWAEGRYEGELMADEAHGHGVLTWANGDRYEGGFKFGTRCGIGKYVGHDGVTYEGEWQGDRIHGLGTLTCPNGERYEGQFRFDERHGLGECWGKDQHIIGRWEKGELKVAFVPQETPKVLH